MRLPPVSVLADGTLFRTAAATLPGVCSGFSLRRTADSEDRKKLLHLGTAALAAGYFCAALINELFETGVTLFAFILEKRHKSSPF
jgi:hypothetical protein